MQPEYQECVWLFKKHKHLLFFIFFWRWITEVPLSLRKLKCNAKPWVISNASTIPPPKKNIWKQQRKLQRKICISEQYSYQILIWATENTRFNKKRLTKQADWNRFLGTHALLLHTVQAPILVYLYTSLCCKKHLSRSARLAWIIKYTLLSYTPILHKWHFPSLGRVNTKVPKVMLEWCDKTLFQQNSLY